MLDFIKINQSFFYDGTKYQVKTVTETAIEIASNSQQSLWVSKQQFGQLLGLKRLSSLFQWQVMTKNFSI